MVRASSVYSAAAHLFKIRGSVINVTSSSQSFDKSRVEYSQSKRDLPRHPAVTRAECLLDSRCFTNLIALSIVLNVVQLGAAVQVTDPAWKSAFEYSEHAFTAIFLFQMVLKCIALGWEYLRTAVDICDMMLALYGVLDTWILPSLLLANGVNANEHGYVKVIRTARLFRIWRVFKLQRRLLVVIQWIIDSLASMFWVGMLLGVIIYGTAIFCVAMFKDDIKLQTYFHDLWSSMLSLFNIVMLDEWGQIIRPVARSKPWLVPFFVLFVIFTSCGVVNVMIGIIVESINAAAARCEEQNHALRNKMKMQKVDDLARLMAQLDSDGNGVLSRTEFVRAIQSVLGDEVMSELHLPKGFSIGQLFQYLDVDNQEEVTKQQFIDGMCHLISNDVAHHSIMVQLSLAQVKKMLREVHSDLKHSMQEMLQQAVNEIHAVHESPMQASATNCSTRSVRVQEDVNQNPKSLNIKPEEHPGHDATVGTMSHMHEPRTRPTASQNRKFGNVSVRTIGSVPQINPADISSRFPQPVSQPPPRFEEPFDDNEGASQVYPRHQSSVQFQWLSGRSESTAQGPRDSEHHCRTKNVSTNSGCPFGDIVSV